MCQIDFCKEQNKLHKFLFLKLIILSDAHMIWSRKKKQKFLTFEAGIEHFGGFGLEFIQPLYKICWSSIYFLLPSESYINFVLLCLCWWLIAQLTFFNLNEWPCYWGYSRKRHSWLNLMYKYKVIYVQRDKIRLFSWEMKASIAKLHNSILII